MKCPFCGKEETRIDNSGIRPFAYWVLCLSCQATGPIADDSASAVAGFLARKSEDEIIAEIGKVFEAVPKEVDFTGVRMDLKDLLKKLRARRQA